MKKNKSPKKVVVISGGAGYLGSFITRKLVDSGFFVVVIGRDTKKNKLSMVGDNIQFFKGDITNTNAVKKISEKVKKQFGSVSIVIHAATAPFIRKPVLEGSKDDFECQFSVNVNGAFNLFKNFYHIISPGGSIIGITTIVIEKGAAHLISGSYVSAKYALRGLLRILASELREKLINVYAVAPVPIMPGLKSTTPESLKEFIRKKSSTGEVTSPEKVADVILSLINDAEKNMNGKSITVPGGVVTDL